VNQRGGSDDRGAGQQELVSVRPNNGWDFARFAWAEMELQSEQEVLGLFARFGLAELEVLHEALLSGDR
jgi:hypothetical protein